MMRKFSRGYFRNLTQPTTIRINVNDQDDNILPRLNHIAFCYSFAIVFSMIHGNLKHQRVPHRDGAFFCRYEERSIPEEKWNYS